MKDVVRIIAAGSGGGLLAAIELAVFVTLFGSGEAVMMDAKAAGFGVGAALGTLMVYSLTGHPWLEQIVTKTEEAETA